LSKLHVELVWVGAGARVERRSLVLPEGATIDDALDALGEPLAGTLRARIDRDADPDADGDALAVAVYGRPRTRATRLRAGDRIELVAPLVIDPKTARRLRVQQRRCDGEDTRWKRR